MSSIAFINAAATRSDLVLDRTPQRTLTFLRGVTFPPIRAVMQHAGYTTNDHAEGWRLVQRACGFDADESASPKMTDEVAEAVKEIDAWDEGGYRRARAALSRLHPEQCEFVFRNLQAATGMQAVIGVITFLDRLDALESGAERKGTRKADQAALATLEKRGIGPEVRKHLRKLVKTVRSSPDLVLEDETVTAQSDDDRKKALVALRAWFEDWSETARSVVPRRDYLIRLGLATRKSNGSIVDEPTDDGEPTPPAAPVKDEKANGHAVA